MGQVNMNKENKDETTVHIHKHVQYVLCMYMYN